MRTQGGLQLGRIGDVEIGLDWSLLVIFVLIAVSLATGVFSAWHRDWSAALCWVTALAAAALFCVSVLVHELSHAFVGRACGVQIRSITLFMFGGVAHMENEPPSWRAELVMAIVGPLTSLALGFVFLWLAAALHGPIEIDPQHPEHALAALGPLASLLLWLGPVNVMLGLFNLVPGFPLDGGRVLRALMWGVTGDLHRATRWASRAGQGFAWLLMSLGFLMMLGLRVPLLGGGVVGGLWIAFIGWFLNNAALASYRQLLVRESLENVPVARLMHTRYASVAPDLRVAALVNELLMPSGQRSFPVEEGGRFLGLVGLRDLQKTAPQSWESTTVREIMRPADALSTVTPREDALHALAILGQRDLNQLPVIEQGRLVGLVRREDILKWLSLHGGAELGANPTHASRHGA